ncbi:MAG: zinc-binding dehydrogenase [Bacteroidetes bacterium]|nr:zinc-binding dehydrogenase [Bacteroidota bacterium]
MKALVIAEKDHPLEVREIPEPQAGPDDAIVKVYSAALNHRDVWIQKGQYAGLKYPITPGSDGSGVVVGAGPSHEHWIGRQVIIDPALTWGDNPAYQSPHAFKILGLPDDGTLAEYVKVPVSNLVEKPAHLSFEEAAALPLAGVTAWRAIMTRAQLRAGEKVLITGIGGGVALFAFQFALAAGAEVYVTSGSEDKLARAISMGAAGAVNYKKEGWVGDLRGLAGGFDITIDGAGGDGVNDLFDLAFPGSRVVFYGATRGNPSNVVLRRIFWKQLNILGSTMGNPDDFKAMTAFVEKHQIRPIVDKIFPLENGEAAFRWMDAANQFGKIVVRITADA